MKTNRLRVVFLFIVGMIGTAWSQAQKAEPAQLVKGGGCVKAGVEAGCLVISDFSAKKTYSLFFVDKKPDIDMAISFEGRVHNGPTSCTQGTPVDVSKWVQLKMKCPKEQ